RALAKTPAGRFPTIADFAHALLPFGPARSQTNVERAARVLKVSGLTVPMGPPPSAALAPTSPVSAGAAPPVSGAVPAEDPAKISVARTAAAWTGSGTATKAEPPKSRSLAVPGALALGVLVGGTALFVALGHGNG